MEKVTWYAVLFLKDKTVHAMPFESKESAKDFIECAEVKHPDIWVKVEKTKVIKRTGDYDLL